MRKLLLTLCYDGSAYHGWQVQENAITVQGCLQNAIEQLFGTRLGVTGCSRTDTGVHANMFCAHICTDSQIPTERVVAALNAHLPYDVAVTACREVSENFHARYSCISKEYKYVLWNREVRNPFYEQRALHYRQKLDAEFLNSQAAQFEGEHDFSAFCASGSSVISKVRKVESARVQRKGDFVYFYFRADGFLYNMVRIMTGTLLQIHEVKIEKDSIRDIILSKDRSHAGFTVPAQGLYLERVNYDFKGPKNECE